MFRASMLRKRETISPSARLAAAASIANHFADHPYLTYAKSFAGYYAFKGELDVLPIFNRMQSFKKSMALPHINKENHELTFKSWQPGERLEIDHYGIKTPNANAPVIIPEVVLVPLLAVDKDGYRLGYGGGYYDRCIEKLRATPTPPLFFGVAFAEQEVEHLPRESHDQALDGLLTPEGVSMYR